MAKGKSPGASAAGAPARPTSGGGGGFSNQAVYIGIPAGSDMENQGVNLPWWSKANKGGWVGRAKKRGAPKYKVGYQNSKDFARELNGMDPDVIYLYQQRLEASGLLSKYSPGKLDKATRAAFKELLSTANQTGDTWQSTLQDIESVGGMVGVAGSRQQERAPFVAQLDDPVTLKQVFQRVAADLYGGDLPDNEIQSMVDAYRSMQLQKQQAAYDIEETGGTVDMETDPQAFAMDKIKSTHPDQVNRVKFQSTIGDILKTFGSAGGGAP